MVIDIFIESAYQFDFLGIEMKTIIKKLHTEKQKQENQIIYCS